MYTVTVCATMVGGEDLSSNTFVKKVFDYYHYKEKEVCIVIKDKASNSMEVKTDIPMNVVGEFLMKKLGVQLEMRDGWFKGNKANFPLIPGMAKDVLADAVRVHRYGTKVMKFWRTELGLKLGFGEFPAWDKIVVDIASFSNTSHILDNIDGFDMRMKDIVEWSSLKLSGGISGLAATKIKTTSGVRKVVDVIRVFIEWSFLVLNRAKEEHEDPEYTRDDDDFETPVKKKNVVKGLVKKKVVPAGAAAQKKDCGGKKREEGKRKAVARVMAAKKARKEKGVDKDMELALALSVSEDQQRQVSVVPVLFETCLTFIFHMDNHVD